jgi:hypothetical protein
MINGLTWGTALAPVRAMASPTEDRTPTDTFLLPGQSFCVGQPWERAELPVHGLPPVPPKPPPATGNLLDDGLVGDPCAGWQVGRCEVVRRLSAGSARRLLALRREGQQVNVVDLRQLDVGDGDGPLVEAWANEASRRYHPNLAAVFDCEVTEEGTFWVTERVAGATLSEVLAACRTQGRTVPLGLSLAVIHEAAVALGALHERTSHGLVSAHSVALGFDGSVKVLDAGLFPCLARKRSWNEVLEATGPYLAPEQVLHGRPPDPKADVFSLAALLHELLSGEPLRRVNPFDDRGKSAETRHFAPPSTMHMMLGKALDEVMFRALSTDRAWRYPTATAFAKELKKAVSSFMWRQDARGEFMSQRFEGRLAQEKALTAHLAERRTRTASVEIPEVVEEVVSRPVEPAPRRVEVPVAVAAARPSKKKKKTKVTPRWSTAVAGLVGLMLGVGGSTFGASAPVEPTPAPPPSFVPFEPEPLVFVDQPTSELPAVMASIGALQLAHVPVPKVTRSAGKLRSRARNEAPVPAWLRKGNRRR